MYSYTSMDRIFSKLDRDITEQYTERDIIEWTGEALEFMQTVKAYEEAVAFVEVVNNQCLIPAKLHSIIQIARYNNWGGSKSNCITPSIVSAQINDTDCQVRESTPADLCVSPCADAVWLDCNGQPIVDYDLAYYRPYFDLQQEYYGWSNSGFCRNNFSPVRLTTSSFFNSLVCTTQEQLPYQQSFKDEYTVIQKSILRFSFQSGFVAIAYTRQQLDKDTGYPMIPDTVSHTSAIVAYIAKKRAERDFDSGRQSSDSRLKYWSTEWNWYCGQVGDMEKMPSSIDEYQNILDQRGYMLPRNNCYYNFFGNLNNPEYRKWNHRSVNHNGNIIT